MINGFRTRIPWKKVNWTHSIFLIGTLVASLTLVPVYIFFYGLDLFQVSLFLVFFIATGLSITLGYHRLFAHLSFKAKWPVKVFTLLFGAAALEYSAIAWVSDHRRHHKHVDEEDDPYNIQKGFWHAHIGWMLFKLGPPVPMDNVGDLRKDRMVMMQHNYYWPLAILTCFGIPALLGYMWGGWEAALGAFLIGGLARVVFVQHMTFFINSLCHWHGTQPYSSACSARDSGLMALFTFGEGYHNYHHEFQHDYRNGVKPWHFDPTKWSIWALNKMGLVSNLRTVPQAKIVAAELRERERKLAIELEADKKKIPTAAEELLDNARARLTDALNTLEESEKALYDYGQKQLEASRKSLRAMRKDFREASERLSVAIQEWQDTYLRVYGDPQGS